MTIPDPSEPAYHAGQPQVRPGTIARILEKLSVPDDITRLSADTFFYGIGKMGEGVAALVLIPVLTRAFSPSEFGLWDVAMTFSVIATMVASLALEVALSAFYFQSEEMSRKKLVASTSVYFRLLSSALVAILVFACASHISEIIFDTSRYAAYFRIIGCTVPFVLGINIFKQLLRVNFAPGKFNIVAVGYAGLFTALAVFLVLKMRLGVSGVLIAALVAAVCFSVVGGLLTMRFLAFQFSNGLVKDMLKFSLPFLPSLFACWVIDFSDRYFLTRMSTLEQVGIYSVGARISSIIILFVTSFQMAWLPFALSIQQQEDARRRYARGLFFFLVVSMAAGTGIVIFARPILVVLTQPQYYGAERVIALLLLATIAYGAYLIINIGLIIAKRTALSSIAIAAGALLNLVLNFALIPRFQMMGAAVATLVSYLLSVALVYWLARRCYPVDYRISRIIKLTTLALGSMAISSLIQIGPMIMDLVFDVLLFATFLLCLWRFFLSDIRQESDGGRP